MNKNILENYIRPLGQKDKEIYPRDTKIIDSFFDYEKQIIIA